MTAISEPLGKWIVEHYGKQEKWLPVVGAKLVEAGKKEEQCPSGTTTTK